MKKRFKHGAVALATTAALLFTGCLKEETPECSNEDVKFTLESLYIKEQQNPLFAKGDFPEIISIDSIRTLSYDKELNRRECRANVVMERDISGDIEYTVSLPEEEGMEGMFYVEMKTSFIQMIMMSAVKF